MVILKADDRTSSDESFEKVNNGLCNYYTWSSIIERTELPPFEMLVNNLLPNFTHVFLSVDIVRPLMNVFNLASCDRFFIQPHLESALTRKIFSLLYIQYPASRQQSSAARELGDDNCHARDRNNSFKDLINLCFGFLASAPENSVDHALNCL